MKVNRMISRMVLGIMMLGSTTGYAQQNEVSGVYIGGHIRRERPGTIATLRNSGFTYALLFNVHVDKDGTLMTDGETICRDGKYVFQQTQPYYQQDIADLKTAPTSISRIEIVIGGWGNDSYDNIRNLINTHGTGSETILYRNFKALKEAIPEIDAVNNDDEHCYDQNTGARFHIMMYDLGYKTTLAPYMNRSYWQNLCKQIRTSRPKAVDRIMVQCYDGGAGNVNSVRDWTFTGVTNIHAGLLHYGNDWNMQKNIEQFEAWRDNHGVKGGFVWVYNDETWNLNQWASAMNRIYGAKTTPEDEVAVKCYSGSNYTGYCVPLPVGTFHQGELAVYGLTADDLESIEVNEGYKVRIYTKADCTGTYRPLTSSMAQLASIFNNKIKSIVIEPAVPTSVPDLAETDDHQPTRSNAIYDLNGRSLSAPQRGKINIIGGKKILH